MIKRISIVLVILIGVIAVYLIWERSGGRRETYPITIVNIGKASRIELGRQLRTIAAQDPAIIGLDFFVNPDSLGQDTVLANVMRKFRRTIQVVTLHRFNSELYIWDSLEVSHPKFIPGGIGFANFSVRDSVLVPAVPIQQIWKDSLIAPFGLAIAQKLGRVKPLYSEGGFGDLEFPTDQIGNNYNRIELADIASGNFRKIELQGKIVLMGYLGSDEDFHYLDKKKTRRASGVEIHAAILEQSLSKAKQQVSGSSGR